MNFFQTILDSIYSPKFYSTILQKSFKQAIGYFLLLSLLLSSIHLIILINPILIETPKRLTGFIADVIDCYPKDLEIKITNGQTSTNMAEPFVISSCKSLNEKGQSIVVIDTTTPYSAAKFDAYKTDAWVTKDTIFYKKNNYEISSYSLNQVKDFKLNKDTLNSYSNNISHWYKFIGPVLLLLSFAGIYLSYDLRLIHLLFLSALIFVLGKIFKQDIAYGQSYKVGLHVLTLGLIVELLVGFTNRFTGFYGFPFMVTFVTLGVVIVNFFLPKRSKS